MIFHESPLEPVDIGPVRLAAFGSTAIDFSRRLHEDATGPLADMITDHYPWQESEDLTTTVRVYDFDGIVFLFIVIGTDATEYEIGRAIVLAGKASEREVITIGVFVKPQVVKYAHITPYASKRSAQPVILLTFLMDLVDGKIETLLNYSVHDIDAVAWFYGTLRSLGTQRTLILEPAWDLDDIIEVLDLPGARFKLLMQTVEVGRTAVGALQETLVDAKAKGIELQLASGIVLIVWQGPPHRLTVRQVSEMGRMLHTAMGAGGQHLILTARTEIEATQSLHIGACAILVISFGSQHLVLGNLP